MGVEFEMFALPSFSSKYPKNDVFKILLFSKRLTSYFWVKTLKKIKQNFVFVALSYVR